MIILYVCVCVYMMKVYRVGEGRGCVCVCVYMMKVYGGGEGRGCVCVCVYMMKVYRVGEGRECVCMCVYMMKVYRVGEGRECVCVCVYMMKVYRVGEGVCVGNNYVFNHGLQFLVHDPISIDLIRSLATKAGSQGHTTHTSWKSTTYPVLLNDCGLKLHLSGFHVVT